MDETPTGARTGYSFILPPGYTVEGAVKIASCVRRPVIMKPDCTVKRHYPVLGGPGTMRVVLNSSSRHYTYGYCTGFAR